MEPEKALGDIRLNRNRASGFLPPLAAKSGPRGSPDRHAPDLSSRIGTLWCSTRTARVSRSAIVGAAAGQYPQNDDHLVLVVEAEADPPVTDAQAPLEGVELADVTRPRAGHEAVETIEDAALN